MRGDISASAGGCARLDAARRPAARAPASSEYQGAGIRPAFGNVVERELTRSGHVTLALPASSAELDLRTGAMVRLEASATVGDDYRFDAAMSYPKGYHTDSGEQCTAATTYAERGPVTGIEEVSAHTDSQGGLAFSFGEKAESYTTPASAGRVKCQGMCTES